jgi:fibronectin-binding autotransporter adhesin
MNCICQRVETLHTAALLALFMLRRDAGLCRSRISMRLSHAKSPHVLAAFVAAVIVLSLAGATPALAQSCTDSWTGGGGTTNWSNGANWSNGSEPGNSDNVCIQESGAAVLLDVGDGIATLTLGSSDSLTIPTITNGSFGLNIGGSSIANSGQITMSAPVSFGTTGLSFSSSGTVTVSGPGAITLQANAFGGDFIGGSATLLNQSTIQGAGSIDMTLNNASLGVVNANESGVQLVVGRNQTAGASTNTGLMEATNGGQLAMGSLTLNNVGGTIKASGTNSYVQLEGEGQGNETFTGGTWTTASGGVIQVVDTSATLDGTNGNTITNSGTMELVTGAAHPGGNFQGTVNNTGAIQILSAGNTGVGLSIPGGQTFTLMGTGNLTMGDGTSNSYNNLNGIGGGTFVNEQLLQGTGAIQNLTSFTNSGTINANIPTGTNDLQLQLGRAGASTNTGTIEATNGGVLLIGSTSITNTGGTIKAVGANSYVSLVGSLGTSGLTISGGTYTTSGGGVIYGQGGTTLDGTTSAITNSGTFIINAVGNPPNINAGGTINNTGTIELLPAASNGDTLFLQLVGGENLTLAGSGKVTMGDGTNNGYNNQAVIGNDFGGGGVLTNQSTIQGSGVIASGTQGLVNSGTINANVPVGTAGVVLEICCEGSSGIVNSGTMEASNGGTLEISAGTSFNNTGTLNAASSSTINVNGNGPFLNLVNGTLTGGTYAVTGTLQIPGNVTTNAAKITLTGTKSQILNPNTNALEGFLTNAAKGSFTIAGNQGFTSAGTFTNQGTITISKGSTFTVGEGGSYVQNSGKTTVNGELTLSSADDSEEVDAAAASVKISKGSLFGNGGTIVAGVSCAGTLTPATSATTVGKLTIRGAYTQTAAGALDANISGAESGEFNLLNVTSTATLGGTLNITLLNDFVPVIGSTFEILTAKSVKGTFATVNGTKINSSEQFTVTYNSNNVTLTVVSAN